MSDIDDTVIDNESAVLAEAAAEVEAAKVAAAAPEPAADPAPDPEPAAPDPVLVALAEQAAATRALAEQVAAQRQPEPAPVQEVVRDFAAEKAALRAAFDDTDSEMTSGEYEAQREAIDAEQRRIETAKAVADALAAEAAARTRQSEELAEAQWQAAFARFSADPGNAALLADPVRRAGFEAALGIEYQATPGLGWDDMLVAARTRLTGVAPAVADTKLRDAEFARQTATPDPAPTLRDIPSAGQQDGSAGAALDGLPISDLEDAIARMSPSEVERYLAEAPGGLRENPRYTG